MSSKYHDSSGNNGIKVNQRHWWFRGTTTNRWNRDLPYRNWWPVRRQCIQSHKNKMVLCNSSTASYYSWLHFPSMTRVNYVTWMSKLMFHKSHSYQINYTLNGVVTNHICQRTPQTMVMEWFWYYLQNHNIIFSIIRIQQKNSLINFLPLVHEMMSC